MATHQTAETIDARSRLSAAQGRSPEIPESSDVYGWLVGSWELEVRRYWGMDVSAHGLKGRGALRLGPRRPRHSGCLDHASSRRADAESGSAHEHVWDDAARVGSVDPGLAHHVDESCRGSPRTADRPPGWK